MKKLCTALLPALIGVFATACTQDDTTTTPDNAAGQATGVDALRAALPRGEQMTIRLPSQSALAPEQATFYGFTRGITLQVNGVVYVITSVVQDIIASPPTETDGETYAVWGPFQDALSPAGWTVRVDRGAEGRYDYVVKGFPRNTDPADAVTVLEGHHTPGAAEAQGTGAWAYDLTAAHALDPTSQRGTGHMAITYSLADERALEVTFEDFQGEGDPVANDTLYRYTEAADGAGTFDFISNLDIDAEHDARRDRRELLQVRSRWLADGPGRSDVTATHGDLPLGTQVEVNECWDAAFLRSYARFAYPGAEVTEGDVGQCPFAEAEYPEFEGFDPDAFADADLVEALPQPGDLPATPAGVADPAAEPALYFIVTRDVVLNTNAHVSKTLSDIRSLTRLPPSDCTDEGCTWGPFTDWNTRLTTRLEVLRVDETTFAYHAEAKRFGDAEDAWRTLFEGGFTRNAAEAGPDGEDADGDGWYVLDLAAIADFQGSVGGGAIRAEFSRHGGEGLVNVRADGVTSPEAPTPADTRYALTVHGDGTGEVSFSLPGDIDDGRDGRTGVETVAAITRWIAGGVGQTDVRVTGGDLGDGEVVLGLQCWDEHAALTHEAYARQAPDVESRPAADAAKCPFQDWADASFPAMGDE